MLLDLLRSSSFVPSWHKATQLSYSPAQTRGRKILDDDDISIYTPEELEMLESLRVQEFVHTHVYDVNLLKKSGDGRRPFHSLPRHWLEFCDDISSKSTTSEGDPTDRAHDGGIGTRSGDVAFFYRLIDWHCQQPLQSP
jgi:hypothetical protein